MIKTRILKLLHIRGDKWLLILPFVLSIFGLMMIFDASGVAAVRDFNDKFHYFSLQLIWLTVGAGLFLFFSNFDYRKLKKFALPLFLFNVILLVMVLVPGLGKEVLGGRRWLVLGPFNFQPAELVKLSLVIYLSSLFDYNKREFFPFLIVIGVIFGLLMLEPDLGTAIIIVSTALALYFVAGAPVKDFILLISMLAVVGPLMILTSDYRKKRLLTFLNISSDVQGDSYHIRQILLALGSGGFFGRGLGQSRQKFLFLPEVTTDSIFAVIAEEVGFLGSAILLLAFGFLIYRGVRTALLSPDKFGSLLAVGIIFFIGFQTVLNISAMVSLVPLTGVPLPFISYGGSSLVMQMVGMGIVYNVSKSVSRSKK